MPRAYKVFMEQVVVYFLDLMELIWLEVGSFSALFKSPEWMESNKPLPQADHSPNTSDQNLKRPILFSIVERSGNHISGGVNLTTVLRTRAVS